MEDKKYNDLSDKYFFAAYINMARHNAYQVIADINTRLLGGKPPKDDAGIISTGIFDKLNPEKTANVPPDLQLKIIKELHKHFPFLKTMLFAFKKPKDDPSEEVVQKMEYAPADYYELFSLLFKTLNSLRNEYTHVVAQPFDFPDSLLHGLRVTFDAAVRKAKTRFNFDPEQMKHLVRQGRGGKERSDFKYKFKNKDSNSITLYGIAFFTCLLLERKYATLFTQRLQGLKDRRVRQFQATYEVFAVHCLTLPKARYTSDIAEGALLMDMLNELKRCPDELFSHLLDSDQDAFRIPVGELQTDEENENGYILLKRFEDRFSYFALRFIDEVNWFKRLRFPVDLGNYHYFLYPKIVDGIPRIGSLWDKMVCYGKLPNYQRDFVQLNMPLIWQQLNKNYQERIAEEELPYIPPTMPHYHLQDDNVAIKIVDEETDAWPQIIYNGNDKKNKPASKSQPDILLSRYELFGLLFYGLLLGNRTQKLENQLINYVGQRRKLYRKIASGEILPLSAKADVPKPGTNGEKDERYDIRKAELNAQLKSLDFAFDCDDLPDEVKCYLMGIKTESFETKAKYLIMDLLDETEIKIERLINQLSEKRKPGSRKDVEVKAGVLADFLARDIMLFQPAVKDGAKAHGKATTTLYNVLQAKLALYGANVETIERTFTECGLLTGNNPHPFLPKIVKSRKSNIVDFYRAYLNERLAYLERCQKEKNYKAYQWVKNNQARRKTEAGYGEQLARNMLELPIALPRGFFTQHIKIELMSLGNEQLNKVLENARDPNNSFMLYSYLKYYLKDDVQEFYHWKRTYKIFDNYFDPNPRGGVATKLKPLDEQERRELFSKVKTWAANKSKNGNTDYERRFNYYEANEKRLRHSKMQDIVLFLASQFLLRNLNKNLLNADGQFYLKDISPTADKGILDKPLEYFGRDFTFCCESKSDKVSKFIKGTTRIYQVNLKVKNIGDFNRFSKDRRLNNLLAYIQKTTVTRAEIESELERYDKMRVEIFRTIHEFESKLLGLFPEVDGKDFGKIMETHQQASNIAEVTVEQIKKIRNAFSHNEYPDPMFFTHLLEISNEAKPKYYADYFLDFLKSNLLNV